MSPWQTIDDATVNRFSKVDKWVDDIIIAAFDGDVLDDCAVIWPKQIEKRDGRYAIIKGGKVWWYCTHFMPIPELH